MINFTKISSICFILISTLSFAQKLSKEHLRNFPKENGFYKTFVLSKYNNKLRANVVLHSDFLKDKDGDLTENVLISFLKKENSWLANDVQVIVKCRGKCINYIDEDTNALYRNNFFYFEFSFDGPRYSGYLFAFKKEDDGYFNLVKMQEVFKSFYWDMPIRWYSPTEKEEFTVTNSEKEEFTVTNSKKEISFDDLEEVSLPFCFKKVEKDVSYHYYDDIDFFLSYHKLKKSLNEDINTFFHKGTIDFLTYKDNPFYELIPYRQNEFDTPPFATKKIQISDSITSILYAYIIEDGEPRVELQTFDKQGNYIDSIILYYRLADECSSERTFCIDKNFKIKIQTEFFCSGELDEGEDFSYHSTDIFKITETGKIVKQ